MVIKNEARIGAGGQKGESLPGYILLVAMIVVIIMAGSSLLGIGKVGLSDADRSGSDIYWRAARPIAITEARALGNNTVLFVVKNKDFLESSLVHVSAAGSELYFPDPILLEPGDSTEFAIQMIPTLRQNSLCEYDSITFYLARGGPEFPQRGTRSLVIQCGEEEEKCSNEESECASDSQCCSGLCSTQSHKCAQCLPKGDSCSSDSQCCQSPLQQSCKEGRCTPCITEGDSNCRVGALDCCQALKCSSQTQQCLSCLPGGNLCSADSECCTNLACMGGRCRGDRAPQ
jgi:hypothetical protein